MLYVIATLTARPDTIDATRDALASLVEPTRAEAGCLGYTLTQSVDDPAVFRTVEQWETQQAAEAHMATPHVGAALAAAGSLLGAPPDIRTFAVVA